MIKKNNEQTMKHINNTNTQNINDTKNTVSNFYFLYIHKPVVIWIVFGLNWNRFCLKNCVRVFTVQLVVGGHCSFVCMLILFIVAIKMTKNYMLSFGKTWSSPFNNKKIK